MLLAVECRGVLAGEPCWPEVDHVLVPHRRQLLHGHGHSERGVLHRPLQHRPTHINRRLLQGLLWCWWRVGGQLARAQLRLSVRKRAAVAELAPGRLNGIGNRWLWAGRRASPQPLFGTQAAKALLSGRAGGPVQAGGLLEQRVAARAAAIQRHCDHSTMPVRRPDPKLLQSDVFLFSRIALGSAKGSGGEAIAPGPKGSMSTYSCCCCICCCCICCCCGANICGCICCGERFCRVAHEACSA